MNKYFRIRGAVSALVLILAGAGVVSAKGLPGGASSLNETHGVWTVVCTSKEGATRCAISQNQVQKQNGQRLLAIQLSAAADGKTVSGVLVLPFGLKLDAGVRLAIDDGKPLPNLRYSTCLPAGCLVPLSFEEEAVAVLRKAKTISVKAPANDTGKHVTFSIALDGFASALDRLTALIGS